MEQLYYKATMKNGKSARGEPYIHYKIGKVVHPKPDKSDKVCSEGIHLAKTLTAAEKYIPNAQEYYLATPISILSQDNDKVRCEGCNIIRRLHKDEIDKIKQQERVEEIKRAHEQEHFSTFVKSLGLTYKNCICREWLDQHWEDITWDDYNAQTLVIGNNGHTTTIKPSMSKKDIRYLLKQRIR